MKQTEPIQQYQQDLETIVDYLNKNKDRFMDGKYYRFEVAMVHKDFIVGFSHEGSGFGFPLDLDSRSFVMALAKLIYGDKKGCSCCGGLYCLPSYKEFGIRGISNDKEISLFRYYIQQWSTLTNEALAHEATLAIRQIKNNTLDK